MVSKQSARGRSNLVLSFGKELEMKSEAVTKLILLVTQTTACRADLLMLEVSWLWMLMHHVALDCL